MAETRTEDSKFPCTTSWRLRHYGEIPTHFMGQPLRKKHLRAREFHACVFDIIPYFHGKRTCRLHNGNKHHRSIFR